jgi:hypothetical protein
MENYGTGRFSAAGLSSSFSPPPRCDLAKLSLFFLGFRNSEGNQFSIKHDCPDLRFPGCDAIIQGSL